MNHSGIYFQSSLILTRWSLSTVSCTCMMTIKARTFILKRCPKISGYKKITRFLLLKTRQMESR